MTLTACALPSAFGTNSFMSSMHPTQEFCASRGMTLDPTTKQCVTPSQSAPPAAEVTGSLPQGAQPSAQSQSAPSATPPVTSAAPSAASAAPPTVSVAQPAAPAAPPATISAPVAASAQPPTRERSPAGAAPIEPDAVIYAELKGDIGLMSELTHYVRASGYRCDSISALAPLAYAHGFKFVCNHFSYKYTIEEKDGRSTVTVLEPSF